MHSRSPLSIAFLHRWKSVPHFTYQAVCVDSSSLPVLYMDAPSADRHRQHSITHAQHSKAPSTRRQLIYNIMAVKSRQQNYWQTAISCRMQSARRSLCREMKIYESYRPICTMPSANRLYRQ